MEFLALIQSVGAGSIWVDVPVAVVVEVVFETTVSVLVIELVSKTVVVVLKVPVRVEAVIVVVVYICKVSVAVTAGGVTVEPGVDTAKTSSISGSSAVLEKV